MDVQIVSLQGRLIKQRKSQSSHIQTSFVTYALHRQSGVGGSCSAILLLLQPDMLSPSRNKMLSGFLQAMLAPFGVKVRLSYASWGHVRRFWGQLRRFWGCVDHVTSAYSKATPNYTSKTLSPVVLETQKNKCKKPIKNQNLLQNANLHDSTGKTSPNIHPRSTFRTLSPVALQLQRLSRQPKERPPLAELYIMTMFLRVYLRE